MTVARWPIAVPCCGSAGSGGSRYARRPRAAARPVRARRRRPPAAARAPATSTRSGVRADLDHVLVDPADGRGRAGAAPTGAATSPTTGPASWSATRSSPCPASGAAAWPTPSPTCARSSSWSSTCSPTSAWPTPAGSTATPACGSAPESDRPAQDRRHRRAAHPGPLDARLRPQRRPRPGDVRPHRAVRHRRQGASPRCAAEGIDVAMREVVDAVAARAVERGRRPTSSGRRGVASPPDDLAPFSRGEPGPASDERRVPAVTGTAARAAGRGRRRRRARHRRAQARVAAGQGPARAEDYRPCASDDARPRPGHRVRGGGLPQHLRVLGRRHRHVHDQRRALHPGLRLLPGRHPPARRAARRRRARAGGRGRGADGPALRGAHRGGPRRPADGGAAQFAATIEAIRRRTPGVPRSRC